MSDRVRRHHSAERKAALLRRHVVEKVPVSQVCEEGQVKPSIFYRWQRDLLEGAATVFSARRTGRPAAHLFTSSPVSEL
ncbi:transposase [Candidatus Fermentibacteria bacterium]|nr:transposase [Candidatus Fermentibacteria bacterium]